MADFYLYYVFSMIGLCVVVGVPLALIIRPILKAFDKFEKEI